MCLIHPGFSIVKTGPRYILIYRNNRTRYACRYLPVRALRISAINIKKTSALIFPIYPRYIVDTHSDVNILLIVSNIIIKISSSKCQNFSKILLNYASMTVGISTKYYSNISNNNMINNMNIDDILSRFSNSYIEDNLPKPSNTNCAHLYSF